MKALKKIPKWILKRRLGQPTAGESDLIHAFRQRVAELLPVDSTSSDSAALIEWIQNRKRLREFVRTDDPRRFLEWDVVRDSMFVGSAPYIATELAALKAAPDWRRRWQPALQEDAIGLPERCRYDLRSSGNLIHHAYSLFRFEHETERRISEFQHIAEFGGGYGSFCRLVHRLGFVGDYVIFDMPEFSALQQYFLRSIRMPVRDGQARGIRFVHSVRDFEESLGGASDCLFIGLWSISETPEDLRCRVLRAGDRFSSYLIAYQDRFGGVDNVRFFEELVQDHGDVNWSSHPIAHLPGNRYLFGTRSL